MQVLMPDIQISPGFFPRTSNCPDIWAVVGWISGQLWVRGRAMIRSVASRVGSLLIVVVVVSMPVTLSSTYLGLYCGLRYENRMGTNSRVISDNGTCKKCRKFATLRDLRVQYGGVRNSVAQESRRLYTLS